MLLERIVFVLLKLKLHGLAAAKIPVIAALLVMSTTGFVVTGTVDGDEVNLVVKPLETNTCLQALIAQTETLLQLDAIAADGSRQLRRLRERAREQAEDQHKLLDDVALFAQLNTSSATIRDELAAARKLVFDAADLGKCQDNDPNTTVSLDLADLRKAYDKIVRDFGTKLNGVLDDAQKQFDLLVKNAPQKPANQKSHASGESDD
jgi:hypothetical protein